MSKKDKHSPRRSLFYLRDAGRSQSGIAVTIISLGLALGLLLQPSRWHSTPSYGNLLRLATTEFWGFSYLAVAVLFAVYLFAYSPRWFAITAHTLTFALFLSWWGAFIIRWLTDDHTTNANVISWAVFLTLIIWSVVKIDETSYKRTLLNDRSGT